MWLVCTQSITEKEDHVLYSVTLSPTSRNLAKKLLQLAITIGIKVTERPEIVFDKQTILSFLVELVCF